MTSPLAICYFLGPLPFPTAASQGDFAAVPAKCTALGIQGHKCDRDTKWYACPQGSQDGKAFHQSWRLCTYHKLMLCNEVRSLQLEAPISLTLGLQDTTNDYSAQTRSPRSSIVSNVFLFRCLPYTVSFLTSM